MDPQLRPLFDTATRPYLNAGRYAWRYARSKLRYDPVFFSLLRRGLLPDRGSLLDLGCGQGVLLSLLRAAREEHRAGRWPREWPAPPLNLTLRGIELKERRVRAARSALGDDALVSQGDVRDFLPQPCSAIAIFDVLFYLARDEQSRVVEKAAGALEPGGLLLVRETDAGGGFAFEFSRWGERFAAALRGELGQRVHYRSSAEWIAELEGCGFAVETQPVSEGTPFSNALFVARKGFS